MERIEVGTVVYLSPPEVYEFLVDFPGYARYSEYLVDVEQDGDGSPGTEYALTFSWWRLSYTARSVVTAADPPGELEWELAGDLDAAGRWEVERVSAADEGPAADDGPATDDEDVPLAGDPPPGADDASRVTLVVEFDPDSASPEVLDLPRLVSLEWVVEKVEPAVRAEAERVVERIVADLEGEPRDVRLEVETPGDG